MAHCVVSRGRKLLDLLWPAASTSPSSDHRRIFRICCDHPRGIDAALLHQTEATLRGRTLSDNNMGTESARRKARGQAQRTKDTSSVSSRSRIPYLKRTATLVSSVALLWGSLGWVRDGPVGLSHYLAPLVDWDSRQAAVKDAFVESWEAYSQHAWGKWNSL